MIRKRGPIKKALLGALLALTAQVGVLVTPRDAGAWKVYTHVYVAWLIRQDLMADGLITIGEETYQVVEPVRRALADHPEYYYAGVIGPDGFPEVIFGQSVLHPENTGAWMRHVYESAWKAQTDPSYDPIEKSRILAFAYGYLTHPAGDMWAHTLVNDFARGVFPSVSELATSVEARSIVLRHQIVEGFIRTATPGFDGNGARSPAPDGYPADAFDPTAGEGSGVSDTSTPGLAIEAPHRFIYETFIAPGANTPQPDRGALLDAFLDLRLAVQARIGEYPQQSIATLLQAHDEAVAAAAGALSHFEGTLEKTGQAAGALDSFVDDCTPPLSLSPLEHAAQAERCGEASEALTDALVALGLSGMVSADAAAGDVAEAVGDALDQREAAAEAALELAEATARTARYALLDAYLAGWLEDIDRGLENWSRLGLGISRGFFDAQTLRDAQDAHCFQTGSESSQLRSDCEDAVSKVDAIAFATSEFVDEYMLPMMGEPDAVTGLRTGLLNVAGAVDSLIATAGMPLNPVREGRAQVREAALALIKSGITGTFGVDVEQYEAFATSPAHWMSVEADEVAFPGLGEHVVEFFPDGEHARLDAYLGLPADHHEAGGAPVNLPGVPPHLVSPNTRLQDGVSFDISSFAAVHNTKVMSSLVLLGTDELNRLAGVLIYADRSADGTTVPANVMTDGLDGDPWLLSIDSDHSWRADRRPRFTTRALLAGAGTFPLWESCQVRSVFRSLFRSWEAGKRTVARVAGSSADRTAVRAVPVRRTQLVGGEVFPDFGDSCSETNVMPIQHAMEAIVVRDGGRGSDARSPRVPGRPAARRSTGERRGDLTIQVSGPTSVRPAEPLERGFRIVVGNDGPGPVAGSDPSSRGSRGYVVEILVGPGPGPRGRSEPDLRPLGRIENTPPLAAGESKTLRVVGSIPDQAVGSRLVVCARVDATEVVAEASEDNNLACTDVTVSRR